MFDNSEVYDELQNGLFTWPAAWKCISTGHLMIVEESEGFKLGNYFAAVVFTRENLSEIINHL